MNHRYATALVCVAVVLVLPAHAFDAYGEWRGQAQYIVTKHGQPAPVVQEVVPLVIRVEPDGKVVGSSPENGCRLLGTVSPVATDVMRLDVTFRDCESTELNRRITGTIAHYPAAKRLAFSASIMDSRAKPITVYEVKAPILRR